MPPALCPIHIQLSSCVILSRCLLEKTGKQRYKSGTDKGYTTACHKLFHTQIGVGNRLDGGRRRVKKYLWSFFRTAPAGQVRL